MVFAQEQKDRVNKIKKVEVIGSRKIHFINEKVFKVNTINRTMIDNVAANTLADVLNQYLNITIVPDAATGRSTVSMFGLSGGYVKILVDNIPMVNDNGYGNDIDITQINLDEVDHIEIAEGSMGVLYGDNAVAGVINIVTKKSIRGHFDVNATLQEEAVGGEYSLKDKGRHIQGIGIAHNISDRWFIKTGISRNDFKGFRNEYKGKNHFGRQGKSIVSDGLRGHEWSPKTSLSSYGLLSYSNEKWNIYYKYHSYDEDLIFYNHDINTIYKKDIAGDYHLQLTADDNEYLTHRFEHQLQLNGGLKSGVQYQIVASYSTQKRRYKQLLYGIESRRIEKTLKDITNQSSKLFFSKGQFTHLFSKRRFFNLTTGYEVVSQRGYDIIASGAYADKDHKVAKKSLSNYDFFAQPDFHLSEKLHFYPGIRLNNNSNYNAHVIWGATMDYHPTDPVDIKAVVGSAYKTPTFRQLYFYMKDANHDIQGNKDLEPEDGISLMLSAGKKFTLSHGNHLTTDIKGFHFNIKDKIDLVGTVDRSGRAVFRYKNINRYKVLGLSLENQWAYHNIDIKLGIDYTGVAQQLENQQLENKDEEQTNETSNDYLFRLNLNALVDYFIPVINLAISAQYKYNGKTQQYILGLGKDYIKGEQEDYHLLGISLRKGFFNRALEVTAGARNLFNVINIKTRSGENLRSAPSVNVLLGYGRSYFIKLKYHLNI